MNASTPAHTQGLAKRDLDTEGESLQDVDTKRTKLDHGHDVSAEQSAQEMSGEPKVEASSSMSAQQGHVHKEERKKKGEKRDWASRRRGTRQEREQPINDEEVEGDDKDRTSTPRLPKRLCALLIGFCGSGYKGMQIQPSEKTIEGVLFKALVNAGAVSKDNADDPVKVGLQRAARTDAGVHAAGNVVSMKIITHVPGIPDLVQRVNEELPPEIRLWSFQRVQNSFNARISCDSRRYTYFFPSYLLIPPKPTSAFYQSFIRQSASASSSASSSTIQVDPFWENAPPEMTREEDMVRKKLWRAGKEKIEVLREAAKHFEGTHNFHNFTVGRDTKDRSCFRHMKKIEVADPTVYGETEWISVMLHGQSFMLHQIRKMMCVLVMSVRTGTPSNIINALFGPLNVVIPKMPSLGLLLENPIFESYSKRVENANSQKRFDVEHTDYRAPIDFDKHTEEMKKFKEEHIYSRMRENEEKLQVFDRWQSIFDHYNGNDLLYYNTQGIIPSAAVVKRGESRPNPFRERKHFDATDFAPDGPATVFAEEDAEEGEAEREENMNKKELEEAEG